MFATRRKFLHASLAASAAAALAAPVVHAQARPKRYRPALVGTGWWGMNIRGVASASTECEGVGMCDAEDGQIKGAFEKLGSKTSDQPTRYRDFRELLEREKPEICIVATPDHWHPLVTIAA